MPPSTLLSPGLRRSFHSSGIIQTSCVFLTYTHVQYPQQTSSFSTTTSNPLPRRDNNPQRGVSTVRRTGPRQPLTVSRLPIPKPVLDASRRSKPVVDENHGLYEFFYSKEKAFPTPKEDNDHGRPWTVEELRHKSWEDIHALWWVCCKERNRIATATEERRRVKAGYGDHEAMERDVAVRKTQSAIKHVLTERYYSWQDATVAAKDDPEIDLSNGGAIYTPATDYLEDDGVSELGDVAEEGNSTVEEVVPVATAAETVSSPQKQNASSTTI